MMVCSIDSVLSDFHHLLLLMVSLLMSKVSVWFSFGFEILLQRYGRNELTKSLF